MARSIQRFDPPPVEMTPELRWMLSRAFGMIEAPAPPSLDGPEAVRLSQLLGIGPRIAARQGQARLSLEVGPENALELKASRLSSMTTVLRCEAAMDRVAEIASEASIQLVFLKFAALCSSVELTKGCRAVADLDVLVAEERSHELYALLLERGWQSTDLPPTEQHLAMTAHPAYGPVEIHRVILGVQPGRSGASATLGALAKSGLLSALEDRPGCWVPTPACQAAHVIVHGLVQHGHTPLKYPPLQMFSDLIDLGIAGDDGESLTRDTRPLVSASLSEDEVTAIVELCRALAGSSSRTIDESFLQTPPGVLLRHTLAGRLSLDYQNALKLKQLGPGLSDRSAPMAMGHRFLSSVFLTRGQIDVIYGRPRTKLGYLARRVLRPFDLMWRALRSSMSFLRDRRSRS